MTPNSYKRLKKNLLNQSTDTIIEWKQYFTDCKSNQKYDIEYFTMAINVCNDILQERKEK